LRIIGGRYKRRILRPPARLPVRPTTDLAKEALFNLLNNRIDFEAIRVLDLFAGTGSISFEFASRGALSVVAVDKHPSCIRFIQNTAEELNLSNLHAVRSEAFRFLGFCHPGLDLVFADPPYDMQEKGRIADLVFERQILSEDGWLVVEHGEGREFVGHPHLVEQRKYGRVHFSFFRE